MKVRAARHWRAAREVRAARQACSETRAKGGKFLIMCCTSWLYLSLWTPGAEEAAMTHEGLGPGDLPGCATGQQVQRLWLHHGRSSGDNIAVARGDAQRTERSVRVWRLRTPFGHRGGGGAREAYLRRGPQFVMRNPKHQRPNHAITRDHRRDT